MLSTPASIPHVEAVLASLVVESPINCKFSIVSDFCLIVDSHFHPSRALERSFNLFIPLTWMYFCYYVMFPQKTMTQIVFIISSKMLLL